MATRTFNFRDYKTRTDLGTAIPCKPKFFSAPGREHFIAITNNNEFERLEVKYFYDHANDYKAWIYIFAKNNIISGSFESKSSDEDIKKIMEALGKQAGYHLIYMEGPREDALECSIPTASTYNGGGGSKR